MRIAIVMSGQPRNFDKGYVELKKTYLDKYDCDIYIHSWKDKSFDATNFFPDRSNGRKYEMGEGWEEALTEMYKPVKAIFENPIVFDNRNIVDPIWRQPLQNCKSMWYSAERAFGLIEDKTYDAYIRTRFDLRYEASLSDLNVLDLSKLHIWDWDTDERVRNRGYYDVFAVGDYTNVGIYSSVFSKLDWYLNYDDEYKASLREGWVPDIMGIYLRNASLLPGWPSGQDSGLRNEYLLRWHLKQSGVPVEVHSNTIPAADGHIIR